MLFPWRRAAELPIDLWMQRRRLWPGSASPSRELELFFEIALEVLCIADRSGAILRISRSAADVLGYKPAELRGLRIPDLVHKEDREALASSFRRVSADAPALGFQARIHSRDKGWRLLVGNAWAPHDDGLVYVIARDVTAQHLQQEALRRSEERFALATQGAADGIWDLTTFESDELWCSQTAYDLLGQHVDDGLVRALSVLRRMPAEDRRAVLRSLRDHFRHELPFLQDCRIHMPDQSLRWFRISGRAVFDDDGRPRRLAGSIADIHNLKAALDRLSYSERMLQETSQIAHIGGWQIELGAMRPTLSEEVSRIYELPPDYQPSIDEILSLYAPEAQVILRDSTEEAIRDSRCGTWSFHWSAQRERPNGSG